MKKYINKLENDEKELFSLNFLLAEFHPNNSKSKDLKKGNIISSIYKNEKFDTVEFYKHTSRALSQIEQLK